MPLTASEILRGEGAHRRGAVGDWEAGDICFTPDIKTPAICLLYIDVIALAVIWTAFNDG